VQPDLEEIKTLINRRTDYSVLMERVAACVPENVWLVGIRLTERPGRRGAHGRHKGSGSFHGVAIEGLVVAGIDRGGEVVREFANALEEDEQLSIHIKEARFVETGVQEIGDTDVLGFEIMCPYK
jgi:Tfp pilus assembly protein PilN